VIKNLGIRNFKSIKDLKLECRRINLFIGEPNTGKSNILETLGLASHVNYGKLTEFVRLEIMPNLFYDENLEEDITINFDDRALEVKFEKVGLFVGTYKQADISETIFSYDYDISGSASHNPYLGTFKFYRFKVQKFFSSKEPSFLLPPCGVNFLAILVTRKELRKLVKEIFERYGLRVVLKPQENKIEVQKEVEDTLFSYPYSLVSDTLQRIIFHLVAIESNTNSVMVFEEPEAHAFPYYTKVLAEQIALDSKENQYFISTHNPYILLSILEKSPRNDVAVFLTYFEDYQTKVMPLSENGKKEILEAEAGVFFDLERLLKDESA